MLALLLLLLSEFRFSPAQSPEQATARIRELTRLSWWLATPDDVHRLWREGLLGGHDCSVEGARARRCFFYMQREHCGNDEFSFRAVDDTVRLRAFGVLACTPDLKSAESLVKAWKKVLGVPSGAGTTTSKNLTALEHKFIWRSKAGTTTALLSATNYIPSEGWQVHLYVSIEPN